MKKSINETVGGRLKGVAKPPAQVQLTPENAAIFSAKFLEMIVVELRKLNATLEKHG